MDKCQATVALVWTAIRLLSSSSSGVRNARFVARRTSATVSSLRARLNAVKNQIAQMMTNRFNLKIGDEFDAPGGDPAFIHVKCQSSELQAETSSQQYRSGASIVYMTKFFVSFVSLV